MSVLLPRLDRASAQELLESRRNLPLEQLQDALPDTTPTVTYAAVGGSRIDDSALEALRSDMISLAAEHGLPDAVRDVSVFEASGARLLRRALDLSPHEASHEGAWSYLTCCWLLDVAIWRFGAAASDDRFIGHINRNTFRRMWWRAEVLGDEIDLSRLGEDELVNIMERPTLFADRRLARNIAAEFLARVEHGEVADRMRLMREATKRLLRLTPFLAFPALDGDTVRSVVSDAFDAAAAGIAGRPAVMSPGVDSKPRSPSDGVTEVISMAPAVAPDRDARERQGSTGFEEVAQAAIDLARRTGRVTNMSLREVAPITSDEAREVFHVLLERGDLVRRGVKRGTHYVLPEPAIVRPEAQQPAAAEPAADPISRQPERPSETALRRLLRRGR